MNNRIGEVNTNSHGSSFTIIEYNSFNDIVVRFDNGYIKNCEYGNFKKGTIKSPYCKTVLGIGFLGEGVHTADINGKGTLEYRKWFLMLNRVYNEKQLKTKPSYRNCYVCEEWHNFQNFAEWCKKNYYEIPNEKMELDKDILFKGNKIYSPDTCVFVPHNINSLFVNAKASRGEYPVGVTSHGDNLQAYCNENGRKITIGTFNSSRLAFEAYKLTKEHIIRTKAVEYKDVIPNKLYEAMMNYIIDIND